MAKRRVDRNARPAFRRHYLKQWRKSRGLTQQQLAEKAGTATATISDLETGKQGYSQITFEAIADALGTEAGLILLRPPDAEAEAWLILSKLSENDRVRAIEILRALGRSHEQAAE